MKYFEEIKKNVDSNLTIDYLNPNPSHTNKILEETIYPLLNKSILAGEYYHEAFEPIFNQVQASFDKIVSELKNKRDQTASKISFLEVGKNLNALATFKEIDILKKLNDIKISFSRFEKYFRIYKNCFKTIIGNFDKIDSGKLIDDGSKNSYHYYKLKNEILDILENNPDSKMLFDFLFQINVSLSYIDEYLECNDISRNKLRDINEYLEIKKDSQNKTLEPLFKILSAKSKFLELKIHSRINGRKKPIQFDNTNPFYNFYEKLNKHYRIFDQLEVISEDEIISNLQKGKYLIQDIHNFNKSCRLNRELNIKDKIDKLGKLEEALKKEFTKINISKFDRFSIKSSINLVINGIVNLKLQDEINNSYSKTVSEFLNFLTGEKNEIKLSVFYNCKTLLNEIKRKYLIHDYFGYSKLLDFLETLIEFMRNDPDKLISREITTVTEDSTNEYKRKINLIIDKLKEEYSICLERFNENLIIAESIEQKPIYLTFEECTHQFSWDKDEGITLFLDSSYILPNNYYKEKRNLQAKESIILTNFRPLRNRIDLDLNLQLSKAKNLEFEKKVKENEFKIVQITAMFVSIATFVLVNVKIFDGEKKPIEHIGVMFGLAACFLLFNGFFKWLVSGQIYGESNKKVLKDPFFIITILLIIISILLLYWGHILYENTY